MTKRILAYILAAFLIMSYTAYANEYIYFTGYLNLEAVRSGIEAEIHAWDPLTGEFISSGEYGYLIEKDASEDGCIAILTSPYDVHDEIVLARLIDGKICEKHPIRLPDRVYRIYACKQGWIYYAYEDGDIEDYEGREFQYKFRRINAKGDIQEYDIMNFPSSYLKMDLSISDNGCIAFLSTTTKDFFDMDYTLYLSWPDSSAISIELPKNPCNVSWLDETSLLIEFYSSNEALIYNMQSNEIHPFCNGIGAPLPLPGSMTNRIISRDKRWMAYQEHITEMLFGINPALDSYWHPIALVSLEDGQTSYSDRLFILNESTQLQFGE